jgi:hypothetical protein
VTDLNAEVQRMREKSGTVASSDPLVAFLYVLLRDHLLCGEVEGILLNHVTGEETVFTNGWLAEYAKDLAARLHGERP